MKISTLLYYVDHGSLALPCFAREYVWKPRQVISLFNSLYRGYPVGTLVFWIPAIPATAQQAEFREHAPVELLVDGQQRVTSIYSVARARSPHFSKDDKRALPSLYFHIGDETFDFYKPCMKDDSCWIDLAVLFSRSQTAVGEFIEALYKTPAGHSRLSEYLPRLYQLCGILDRNIHVEYLPGDVQPDEAVEVYLVANGGGLRK